MTEQQMQDFERPKLLQPAPAVQSGNWRVERDAPFLAVLVAGFLLPSALGVFNKFVQAVYIVIAIGLLVSTRYGRVYYLLLVIWPRNRWIQAGKGRIWSFNAKRRGRNSFPLQTHYVSLDDRTTLGLLHDPKAKVDGIVIVGDGFDLVSSSLEEQVSLSRRLATVAKELTATIPGYSVGIGLVHARRPLNVPAVTTNMAELIHPDVKRHWEALVTHTDLMPDDQGGPDLCDRRVAENMASLIAEYADEAAEVTMAIVVSVYRESLLAKLQQTRRRHSDTQLSEREVYGLNVVRLARTATNKLRMLGIANPRVLDKAELADYVRASWDVTELVDYHMQSLPYQVTDQASAHFPHGHIAVLMEADHNQLQAVVDDTYHGLLMVTQMDSLQTPYYLRSLYTLQIPYYTVSLVGTTLKAGRDVKLLEFSGQMSDAIRSVRQIDRPNRSMKRRDNQRERKADQLDDSSFQLAHNLFLHVLASSSDELEDHMLEAVNHLEGLNMSPERVDQESILWKAVLSAGTGFNLL